MSHTVKFNIPSNAKNSIPQREALNNLNYRRRAYTSNALGRGPAAASRIIFSNQWALLSKSCYLQTPEIFM